LIHINQSSRNPNWIDPKTNSIAKVPTYSNFNGLSRPIIKKTKTGLIQNQSKIQSLPTYSNFNGLSRPIIKQTKTGLIQNQSKIQSLPK